VGTSGSFVGRGLFFIPCYWLGFYQGRRFMRMILRVADEPSTSLRAALAAVMFLLYCLTFTLGQSVQQGFDDRCSSFWQDGQFAGYQVFANAAYYMVNLWSSVLWIVFIAAAIPFHLKYLAKVCFLALLGTAYTPCLLNFSQMALQIRGIVSSTVAPGLELAWSFGITFLYTFVAGGLLSLLSATVRVVLGAGRLLARLGAHGR